nr:DUF3313 family protein [Rhizobium leguminosarum]
MQTIATDFSDMGVDVSFTGPRRLAFVCKPQALTRAITNLIDNASRYAKQVEIDLQENGDGGIRISEGDNGPGLTDEAKAKVLEPFFKVDKSRQIGAKGGSGLELGREGSMTGSVNYAVEIYDAASNRLLSSYVTKQYPNAMNIDASFTAMDASMVGVRKGADALLAELK